MRILQQPQNVLVLCLLAGLLVGLTVNLCILDNYGAKLEASQMRIAAALPEKGSDNYWRGTVDTKLESIDSRIREFSIQLEKLDCTLTEVKVTAAREGTLYGCLSSLIVLLASILGRNILRRNGKIK